MRQAKFKVLPHILFKKAWVIMEFTFSELKQKEVINLNDGKHLGKVCDMSFTYPENNGLGIFVTGSKGFKFNRQEQFIPMKFVTKIGEDAILVKFPQGKPDKPDKPNCPPPKPPQNGCCPPPDCCPPDPWQGRRNLDEYE